VSNYSSHPRIIPDLDQPDYIKGSPLVSLKPYKLAKIKQSADVVGIFDGTVNNTDYGAWAVGFALDTVAGSPGKDRKPYLTTNYALDPAINAGQPVSLLTAPGLGGTAVDINTDSTKNPGNIRFRHNGNKVANGLMMDGHVQSFNYNKSTQTSDLLRKNIYVNP
jgi:prepilin-type processing-associated H-X9-DG protein